MSWKRDSAEGGAANKGGGRSNRGWWKQSFEDPFVNSSPRFDSDYRPKGSGKSFTEQRLAELEHRVMEKERRKETEKTGKKARGRCH